MKNSRQLATEAVDKLEPGLMLSITGPMANSTHPEIVRGREMLQRKHDKMVEIVKAAIDEQRTDPITPDGKETVIFINEQEAGFGLLAHCRKTAHEWLDSFLDELEDGEPSDVTFKRKLMTKAEIEAMPEV